MVSSPLPRVLPLLTSPYRPKRAVTGGGPGVFQGCSGFVPRVRGPNGHEIVPYTTDFDENPGIMHSFSRRFRKSHSRGRFLAFKARKTFKRHEMAPYATDFDENPGFLHSFSPRFRKSWSRGRFPKIAWLKNQSFLHIFQKSKIFIHLRKCS